MSVRRCAILTIGFEILQGRIVDTNAAYIAKKLYALGHQVAVKISVGDRAEDIMNALRASIEVFDCDTILTTGGLGPTPDDITLECIARFFNLPLEVNEEALKDIEAKYRERGLELTPSRIKMAKLPRGAIPLLNPVGIAPGIWLETQYRGKDVTIISLPGVPKEMIAIFEKYVEPKLRIPSRQLIEASVAIRPCRESDIAEILKEFNKRYPQIYVKTHPYGHEVEAPSIQIYMSLYASNSREGLELCQEAKTFLLKRISSLHPNISIELLKDCSVAN